MLSQVTGLMEYSLFHLSKTAEEGSKTAPSSPAKARRLPLASGGRQDGILVSELDLALSGQVSEQK